MLVSKKTEITQEITETSRVVIKTKKTTYFLFGIPICKSNLIIND